MNDRNKKERIHFISFNFAAVDGGGGGGAVPAASVIVKHVVFSHMFFAHVHQLSRETVVSFRFIRSVFNDWAVAVAGSVVCWLCSVFFSLISST